MNSSPLTIAIAGAGIGGLSAALATGLAGHRVHLFERTAEFSEVGAGIQMGPNVWHCLRHWQLEEVLAPWVAYPQTIQARSAQSDRLLGQFELGASVQRRYGAPYTTIHRADLHQALLAQVRQQTHVQITTVAPIHGFTQQADAVTLPDAPQNAPAAYDALVAADGVWSRLRQQLLQDGQPQATGHVAFRGLIRQNALPQQMRSNHVTAWMGPRMHAVLYPIRGGEWLNMVIVFARAHWHQQHAPEESWDLQAPQDQLQELLAHACTPLRNMAQAISAHGTAHQGKPWRMWPLFGRPPVRHAHEMAQHRVALLGDAAHPMLPYLAQGAAMAIEDAWQLQHSLSLPDPDVAKRLEHYAKNRYQRNARVQKQSMRNGRIFHLSGLLRVGRDISLGLLGGQVMDSPWLYRPLARR